MSELSCVFTIADRSRLAEIVSHYRLAGLELHCIALGRGTARRDTLSLLGLERTEKAVCLTVAAPDAWRAARRRLVREVRIDVPGTGIAFTVPMSSVGGPRELAFLTQGQEFSQGEESVMKGTEHELLVVMSNQGSSELVMDAARQAGAGGGTVIHARGTGMERAERFLGISLASEKDLIFIVTRTARKNTIMSAIMRQAGPGTRAGAVVFSLPVTDTAGLRLLEDEEDAPPSVPAPPAQA